MLNIDDFFSIGSTGQTPPHFGKYASILVMIRVGCFFGNLHTTNSREHATNSWKHTTNSRESIISTFWHGFFWRAPTLRHFIFMIVQEHLISLHIIASSFQIPLISFCDLVKSAQNVIKREWDLSFGQSHWCRLAGWQKSVHRRTWRWSGRLPIIRDKSSFKLGAA